MNTKYRVLVVDDEEALCTLTCELLTEAGMDAIPANDTTVAAQKINSDRIDVILLDILMPGESGLEFLARCKKDHPNIPIIIVTGKGYDKQLMESAHQFGAAGYVGKDAGIENIIVALRNACKAAARARKI